MRNLFARNFYLTWTSAREMYNSTEHWKQQFTYDRWGNRRLDTGITYGTGINNKAFAVNATNNRLTVPTGQSGTMTYDAAGNLTHDTYTGAGIGKSLYNTVYGGATWEWSKALAPEESVASDSRGFRFHHRLLMRSRVRQSITKRISYGLVGLVYGLALAAIGVAVSSDGHSNIIVLLAFAPYGSGILLWPVLGCLVADLRSP